MRSNLLANPAFRAYLNRRILCEVHGAGRRVALTFDDGPNPYHTPPLLDLLADRGVRATFFVVGRRAERFGGLLKRMAAEGHEIGNHSYLHAPLVFMTRRMIGAELRRTSELIVECTARPPRFVRPPMGWFNDRLLRECESQGLQPVIGSVNPRDSRRPGAESIEAEVLRETQPGSIIILHDGGWRLSVDRSQTLVATGRIIDDLLSRRYAVGSLGELVDSAR